MTTTLPASETRTSPKPRRRWWLRGFLLIVLLFLAGPTALYFYSNYQARVTWDAAEEEADRTDPEWRNGPLLKARRVVPDNENSAFKIIAAAGKAKDFTFGTMPNYGVVFDNFKPQAPLNDAQAQLIRGELGKIPGPLDEARQIRKYPYGRMPIKISPIWVATLLPDHQKVRELADWLKHDAWLLAHDAQHNEAVESCQACLCVARVMGDEPIIISHLIRVAVQKETIIALERVLAQGAADDAPLKEMQALLELEIKECTWLHSLRGERAGCHAFFDDLRHSRMPMVSLNGFGLTPATTLSDKIAEKFPSIILNSYPEHLRFMTRAIEIAKLPLHEQRPKIQAWEDEIGSTNNRVIKALTPAIAKVYNAECRSQADLRAAVAAVACERYRLLHNDWPKSLDDLVQAKLLSSVPSDPIDGKALRFRKNKDGIVIYSIGNNEKDDGGHIERDRADTTDIDVGFRLWNMDARRKAK